jgi:NADPH:quinone reductase-like Zn-dependent oxidoreductase
VWIWGAPSYRPSGTAAQYTVVPDGQAVDLPDGVLTSSARAHDRVDAGGAGRVLLAVP